ncbi:uncharacterized protein si:dkey-27h10.2 [Lampris incognitus]|uniref:uncharacterized protein si:dkey-27h10.2 n=1 Tax=Lampris incognitus TaxID=2546036 RepID=UPI0024B4CE3C|nr:uncharacterized protein si:dkey-27h10.2 [Lampris incognitus]
MRTFGFTPGLVMSSVMAKMDQNGFSTNPLINATTEVTPGYTLKGLVMSSVMAQEQTREGDQNRFSTKPQINATTETNQTYKFTAPMDQNQSAQSSMSTTNIAVSSSTSPSGPSPTMPTLGSIFSVRSTAPRLFPTKLPKTNKTTVAPRPQSDDSTGFIIVIVISLAVILLIVACCVTNRKAKMYSVDFSSRQDDVQIPLSTVRPDGPKAQDGVKTFDSVEIDDDEPKVTKDVENVEATVEAKEEEKEEVCAQFALAKVGEFSKLVCNTEVYHRVEMEVKLCAVVTLEP